MAYSPNGAILWEGLSQLDGITPIVVIATGLNKSTNSKTGNMVQTYILTGSHPVEAVKTGLDKAICGDCPHRGDGTGKGRTCYVTLIHGPLAVWRCHTSGNGYAPLNEKHIKKMTGRGIRFGTYGDPAAAPLHVWQALADIAEYTTGYTHQWRTMPEYTGLMMASVDSKNEAKQAHALGYRTFRVQSLTTIPLRGEVVCPASVEAGKKLQCADCQACSGTGTGRKSNIIINAHGTGSNAGNLSNLIARVG